MGAMAFTKVEGKVHTRDGRQWLKDAEFCDSIKTALKSSFDGGDYLSATVKGKAELRKLRGALRHFAEEAGQGLSLKTDGDETKEDGQFTVTFRAQVKRDQPEAKTPRKVRRRKDETDAAYIARVQELHPRAKNEKQADYDARIALVSTPK